MEQRKIEHITLHLIVFGTIAIIGVLARQTVLHYGWDEFSSYLILVVCSIVIGAIYLNLQMAFRQLLSPTIERCFMRFEGYRNKAVVVEAIVKHSKLAESTIISKSIISEPEIEIEIKSDTTEEVSTPSCSELNEDVTELPKEEATPSTINKIPIEESNQPSEYEIFRANAMAEKERASQEKLDKVLSYTKNNLVLYLSETDLNRLCGYITEYYLSDSLPKVEQIKVDAQLKTIDIMHFGWNIGKAFGKPRLQTATFIKRVFAHTFRDSEISTIERKMSHTESECRIKLDKKIALAES
ncbi:MULTISPECIES: mobilization protein [Bacteroidales]|uniref:mobilization protein n=1 Tax=Bacteroidales TaxID=171549 RepID=UPI000ECB4E22|nr:MULTISPECIES: mobilization protein [Bacteroidales]RGN41118.1 mobilization protein [Bacteroides caccae]